MVATAINNNQNYSPKVVVRLELIECSSDNIKRPATPKSRNLSKVPSFSVMSRHKTNECNDLIGRFEL